MTQRELQERTLVFAVAVFRFARPLFRDADSRHVAQQLVRASSSVAANYRASCLARSPREWLARLGVVREEADESSLWLEFVRRAGLLPDGHDQLAQLSEEADQLSRIFAASWRTSRNRQRPREHLPD
jgi:four helix bundle protein